MQSIFIIISLCGAFYFFISKKGFNVFSLAYFSAIIYFLPFYFGYINEPIIINNKYIFINKPLENRIYIIGILVIVFILFGSILSNKPKSNSEIQDLNINMTTKIFLFYFSILLWGAVLYLYLLNGGAIFSGKIDVLSKSQIASIFLRSSTVYFVVAILSNNKKYIINSILIFIVCFLIGIRSYIAIGLLAYLLIVISNNKSPLIKQIKPKLVILTIFLGYIMVNGKYIYSKFQVSGTNGLIDSIFDYRNTLKNIAQSEPFSIQMILNKTLEYDFHIGSIILKDTFIDFFYLDKLFNIQTTNFNNEFTEKFFVQIEYGLAYNIWAEAISIGGILYLIIFCIIFTLSLHIFNSLLNKEYSIEIKSLIAVLATFIAFYIHRNSLSSILTISKTIFIFTILILLASKITKTIIIKSNLYKREIK